ncbi:MAG: glycosyltransferase family 2 protein [Bryobacteraceae bacterium]
MPRPHLVVESVSIIVACRNERASLGRFLGSLVAQQGVPTPLEIVIADGRSEDGTRAVLEQYAASLEGLPEGWTMRVLDNPGRIASTGLNLALQGAAGKIILRMDAHTEYAQNYVAECLRTLQETGAANVGGPALTKGTGYWQQAIALAFHSPFFSGGARFHNPHYEGVADTVPYGCWRRQTLETLGGFDETLVRNQDDELNFRITQAGGVIWQSPAIRSWYYPRRNLFALARQYFEYGYWKPAVIAKYGRPAHWRHLAPATAALFLLVVALIAPFYRGAAWLLFAMTSIYGLASVGAALAATRSGSKRFLPAMPLIFATVHTAYAFGFLLGGWAHRRRQRENVAGRELSARAEAQ